MDFGIMKLFAFSILMSAGIANAQTVDRGGPQFNSGLQAPGLTQCEIRYENELYRCGQTLERGLQACLQANEECENTCWAFWVRCYQTCWNDYSDCRIGFEDNKRQCVELARLRFDRCRNTL